MFEEGSFLFTYDLKSAYHSISINDSSKSWLGFSLEVDGKINYYIFNSLPCGTYFLKGLKSGREVLESKLPQVNDVFR